MVKICEAFSCIILRNKKAYWKLGIDSHNNIKDKFKLKDDTNYCPIEIAPNNNNYINPDEWIFKFDDKCPDWWKQSHEKSAWFAHKQWLKELNSKLYKNRIRNMVHPFKLPMVKRVNNSQIRLLKQWSSVCNSVRYSVWYSVWDSVGYSVWDSVWYSVRDSVGDSVSNSVWDSVSNSVWYSVSNSVGNSVWYSVRDSVRESVYGYMGYLFRIKRKDWIYTNKIKCNGYPFMLVVKLWKQGLVPSFDGEIWRLHSGNNAKVVFKINKDDLLKFK